jgi:uncharacterized protein YbgA (DUF1722 family)/uncharacterized protein YbbK (DUF523 family)
MDILEKPVVVVSKCLGFAHCRWNGLTIVAPAVERLKTAVNFLTVCPEVEIGLGVPRDPIRVVKQKGDIMLVQPATGRNLTKLMKDFVASYLAGLAEVDGFILKEKSPSCGTRRVKIYPGPGKAPVAAQGPGFFGGAVLEKFAHLPSEDEGRLNNFKIREHFLTRLFAVFRFRKLKHSPSFFRLVEFQAQNKLMFMAYNRQRMIDMGKITANHEKKSLQEVLTDYESHFYRVFAAIPRYTSNINVLMHAFGYVSKRIAKEERDFFLGMLEKYRDEHLPLSALTGVLKAWIIRFEVEYLRQQTFFDPYPESLMELGDSGKGREF